MNIHMKYFRSISFFILAFSVFAPFVASAHQPRINDALVTSIPAPEISKAYYGILTGEPHIYSIEAKEPFDLYVNILVPDIDGQNKDVSVIIIKDGDQRNPLARLEAKGYEWKKFFEPFGHDTYWQGPEYKARAEAGDYQIIVSSSDDDSKYSLAVGEIEAFDMKEGLNAIHLIPILKKTFFAQSPADFILSPFGAGYIFVIFVLAFIFGCILKFITNQIRARNARFEKFFTDGKNLHNMRRFIRLAVSIVLLLWAITTNWNQYLIFFSGFAMFEAICGWCFFCHFFTPGGVRE